MVGVPDEECTGRSAAIGDATYRRQSDKELAESLWLLDTLLTRAPVGFVFLDRDLRYVRINEQLAEINGFPVAAHLGRTVAEIVPALEATIREVAARILATGQPVLNHEFAGETARAPGSTRYWNESWYPVRNEQGEIIGFGGIVDEITARKQAEAAQRLSNECLELAVTASKVVLWQQDLELRYLWIRNPVPGFESAVVVGKRNTDLMERADEAAQAEAMKREVIRSGVGKRQEFMIHIENAARHYDLLVEPTRDAAGVISGVTCAAIDITERKRTELNLIDATAAAEKASRAKSDFLASMSHELRTPLNAILGFAQLLDSGPTPLTPAQKHGNDKVVAAGWHLLGLINEILDLAKIDAGKVVLSWESLSVADVLLESHSLVEPMAQRRGITMRFPQFVIPYFVKGDRIRLKQILINLLSNAVKYNRPQGSVSVEYTLATPDSIRIGVRDTGAGLTPEQLAQLFEPFNRLGRNADVEGAGIGLVVAKRLVELMGGTIGAESSVGVGSLFWIELALAPAPPTVVRVAEQAMPVQPPTHQQPPRKTVLYVEDNAASLALVEELFTRHSDLRLLTATDGLLGIELARTFVPDVIMMDINMPGMNGIEAMQTLRADPSTAHIPVIAVSAFAMPAEIDRALEAGFFSYLTKPINLKEFIAALEVAITFSQTKSTAQLQ